MGWQEVYPGTGRVPIRSWLPHQEIDAATQAQLVAAASHPDAALWVSVMPDAHVGYGVPIGCVLATEGSVIPNAVGVDIGCGVAGLNTGVRLTPDTGKRFWHAWAGHVRRMVPTGFNWHDTPRASPVLEATLRAAGVQPMLEDRAACQLGTLGGGNHFLEAAIDQEGFVWLLVHSGSRKVGMQIAKHYHEKAVLQSAKWPVPPPKDLESLANDTQEGDDYWHDMAWALMYAAESRAIMLDALSEAFSLTTGEWVQPTMAFDCVHNDARREIHEGQPVTVHRKGATKAGDRVAGAIPGSMGTLSFIVSGRGNPASLMSCSHGSGRVMGRKHAKRTITLEAFERAMEGTFTGARGAHLDEAPQAYKDSHTVIARQADLVRVEHTLQPVMTIKGDARARDD